MNHQLSNGHVSNENNQGISMNLFDYYKEEDQHDNSNGAKKSDANLDTDSDSSSTYSESDEELPDFEYIAPKKSIQNDALIEEKVTPLDKKPENLEEIDLDFQTSTTSSEIKKPNYKADSSFASFLNSNPVGASIKGMLRMMSFDVHNPTGLGKHGDGIVNPLQVDMDKDTGVASVKHDEDTIKRTWEFSDSDEDVSHQRPSEKQRKQIHKEQIEMEKHWHPKSWKKQGNIEADQEARIDRKTNYQLPPQNEPKTVQPVTSFPDVYYRLNIVIDKCELNIHSVERRIDGELYKQMQWKESQKLIQNRMNGIQDRIKKTENIIKTIDECIHQYEGFKNSDTNYTFEMKYEMLNLIMETFKIVQYKYADEYQELKLDDLLITLVYPLLEEIFSPFDPFEFSILHDTKRIQLIESIMILLRNDDRLESLLEELLVTKILEKFVNWNPINDTDQVYSSMSKWIPVFPESISSKLLRKIILPKIEAFVHRWNPLEIAGHPVIIPWVPLLGQLFEKRNIYTTVIQKLVGLLHFWNPSDHTAHTVISPWKSVFKPHDMQVLLSKGIIPPLRQHLSQILFRIESQDFLHLKDVILWKDTIPAPMILKLLESEFFTKWLKKIYEWVAVEKKTDQVDKLEVWISQWYNVFPETMQNDPFIRQQFKSANHMLNEFKSGGKITPFHLMSSNRKIPLEVSRRPSEFIPHRLQFKELIQRYCAKIGLSFRPLPGSEFQSHQLYQFGNVDCFIKAECLWIQINGEWNPVSLKTITDYALSKK